MFDTSKQWLDYSETVHPRGIDLGLHRIAAVADFMQLTPKVPVITVAGTNGKGSTVAILSALYLAQGYRVANYTSPHLIDFNERIQINGQSVDEASLVTAFSAVESARLTCQVTLTYFEFAVLVSLYIFSRLTLDVIILEIGLGGRLDAVNIVAPTCAVITNIDFDHQAILGYTREAIGYEKAGIIRPGIPVIFGDMRPVESIKTVAETINAKLYSLGEHFHFLESESDWTFENAESTLAALPIPHLPLVNACIALQVCWVMRATLPIQLETVAPVLKNVSLLGRWQKLPHSHCEIRVDVAHNPQSVSYLAKLLQQHPVPGRCIAVCSILSDKDHVSMLMACKSVIDEWFIAPLTVDRATPLPSLLTAFNEAKIDAVQAFDSIASALGAAIAAANENDRIICFGSFYTVAESLKTIQNERYNAF